MKSIKEKAQEWADMYPSCGMADKSFEAGADYVLDKIEKATSAEEYYKNKRGAACCTYKEFVFNQLIETFKELKG